MVNKPHVQLRELDIPADGLKVHLKDYGWIKVFRFAGKNNRTDYIGTSRLDLTHEQIKTYFERCWRKADEICEISQKHIATMPKNKFTHELITVAVNQLNEVVEIGDIMRYEHKQLLSGYAGIDSPPSQSGKYNQQGKRVTKCGSAHLHRILFMVMWSLLVIKLDDKVYLEHFLPTNLSIYLFPTHFFRCLDSLSGTFVNFL